MVTRAQLVNGAADYLQHDIASTVPETGLKIALYALGQQLRVNSAMADYVLNNGAVRLFLAPDANGAYDVDALADTLKESMQKYGGLTITLPVIPMISKGEKTLTFCAQDVENLRGRIANSPA